MASHFLTQSSSACMYVCENADPTLKHIYKEVKSWSRHPSDRCENDMLQYNVYISFYLWNSENL